jgi:trypsin
MRKTVIALLACLVLTPGYTIVMRHDREEQAYIALAKKFPATVVFHHANSRFATDGIGTLIHSRWVLTAGHIAAELAPGDVAELGGKNHEVEAVIQHPGWKGVTSWEDVQRDIALVRLRTAVIGIEPARLYTGADEAGMTLTFVGMGRHGTGLTGPNTDDSTMRGATNRVHKVEGTHLVFRFDAPGDPEVTPLEGISGDGDSGGPAYLERDGKIYVVGVGSAQDSRPTGKKLGRYGVLELYPRVSSFAPWIEATLKAGR